MPFTTKSILLLSREIRGVLTDREFCSLLLLPPRAVCSATGSASAVIARFSTFCSCNAIQSVKKSSSHIESTKVVSKQQNSGYQSDKNNLMTHYAREENGKRKRSCTRGVSAPVCLSRIIVIDAGADSPFSSMYAVCEVKRHATRGGQERIPQDC